MNASVEPLKMPIHDTEARKTYAKDHYLRKKESYIESNRRQRHRKLELVQRAKERPCADCGVQYPYYVMQFDHVRGTKAFHVSEGVWMGKGLAKIQAEIAKCEVVCANCHAERTQRRRAEGVGFEPTDR